MLFSFSSFRPVLGPRFAAAKLSSKSNGAKNYVNHSATCPFMYMFGLAYATGFGASVYKAAQHAEISDEALEMYDSCQDAPSLYNLGRLRHRDS